MRVCITVRELRNAEKYMTEQFKEHGYAPWLEGWICGFTDPVHQYDNDSFVQEELMNHLRSLRQRLEKNCDKCGEVAKEIYWNVLDEMLLCPTCYIREMVDLTQGGEPSEK